MNDSFSSRLECFGRDDEPSDDSDDLRPLTALTALDSLSQAEDLLSQWNAEESGDEELPDHLDGQDQASELLHDLLESHDPQRKSGDSKTYVPDDSKGSFLASLLYGSFDSRVQVPRKARLQLPDVNDDLFGFRLLHKLGAGSFARVFLARQGELADREVVLKVSAIEGSEPQTMAQLQHTHVVPIYSVHENAECGLRAVCMPYFGGASLNRVLEELWRKNSAPATGQQLIDALDSASGPEPAIRVAQREAALQQLAEGGDIGVVPTTHTARTELAGKSLVQAAAWIVARLAEGLQHSHERHVIHRDIKPSNILLSAECQPLLLDFNVSQVIDGIGDASMGGTLSYMAPEHLLAARTKDLASLKLITHRSDIYSLGLVLFEILTGESPFRQSGGGALDEAHIERMLKERANALPSLRKTSPLEIPWSLESISRKCLHPDPTRRYASAAQLAEDLNRFLADQPLKFAPELSGWEQLRKWIRRHPRLTSTSVVSMLAAAIIIPGIVLLGMRQVQLQDAESQKLARQLEVGTLQSLSMVNTVLASEDMLREGIFKCQQALQTFNVLQNPQWEQSPYWVRLPGLQRQKLAGNIRELLIVLAAAEFEVASDRQTAAASALTKLDIAEQIAELPASRALYLERARYLTLLDRDLEAQVERQKAVNVPAVSTHDLYLLAAAHAREGHVNGVNKAISLLNEALAKDPSHYWSHFERALCHQELGDSLLAISDLGECIGLWPRSSWAYFNRGHLLDQQGRDRDAEQDYSMAIRLDPQLTSAYYNRGLVRLELREYAAALSDFDRVRIRRPDDTMVQAGRAMAFAGLGQFDEADREFTAALERKSDISPDERIRLLWTYAFAIAAKSPVRARQMFHEVLTVNPDHPQANYGLGMISMEAGELEEAVRCFDQALKTSAHFPEPMRYRAVSLARLGRFTDAAIDIEQCIAFEPANGETLYAAACVAAITSRQHRSDKLREKTLKWLEQAIACKIRRDRAAHDSDFSAFWSDPDFRQLTGQNSHFETEEKSL